MNTPVELPDALLREAKRVALRDRTTVRALIERGLRSVLAPRRHAGRFVVRVIAVDTNVLVYAHRQDSEWHEPATRAVRQLAEGSAAPWTIPWPCVHEFLAIATPSGC